MSVCPVPPLLDPWPSDFAVEFRQHLGGFPRFLVGESWQQFWLSSRRALGSIGGDRRRPWVAVDLVWLWFVTCGVGLARVTGSNIATGRRIAGITQAGVAEQIGRSVEWFGMSGRAAGMPTRLIGLLRIAGLPAAGWRTWWGALPIR